MTFTLADKDGNVVVPPACDARNPPMDPSKINDNNLVSRRNSSHVFGDYFSMLFITDTAGCADHMPESYEPTGNEAAIVKCC